LVGAVDPDVAQPVAGSGRGVAAGIYTGDQGKGADFEVLCPVVLLIGDTEIGCGAAVSF
jgi:hypothetical protein